MIRLTRIYRCNVKTPCVAVIKFKHDSYEYVYDTQDEEGIADILLERIGARENEINDIPVFIEASSWCSLAGVGEEYEEEDFTIYIEEA